MRLHVDGLDEGHLVGHGHVVLHQRARQELPRLVVAQRLVEAAADALGHAAVDLAVHEHGIDHPPAEVPAAKGVAAVSPPTMVASAGATPSASATICA